MNAILEKLSPRAAADLVACEVVRGPDFGCQWHFHPEAEILLTLEGGTHRWVGDKITPLAHDDLVFIGPNLPHDFRNQRVPGVRFAPVLAIVLQFRADFLGPGWLTCNDVGHVFRLFQRAQCGLEIGGATRTQVSELLRDAAKASGLRRLIVTLEILEILSRSPDTVPIASPGFTPELNVADSARMAKISAYIEDRISEPLYIHEVAQHAGMSEVTFSRFLRSRAGRTFSSYLNELRIARVCRLLAEKDASITELAFACGFDSMANFGRQFLRLQGCSPRAYRQRVLKFAADQGTAPA